MADITAVNIGDAADDGNGDPLRTAFGKLNDNDEAINTELALKANAADIGGLAALDTAGTSQLDDGAVTYAKMQDVSSGSTLLGRGDSGSGDPQEITVGANLQMIGTTLSATGAELPDGAVTNVKIRDAAALSVIGRSANSSGDVDDIATTAGSLHVLREASNVIGFGALSTAYITSGTFADTRIAESNVTQYVAAIDHDALLNFVANEHVDHSAVQVSAGTGLQGGGAITASVTLDLADTAVTPDEYTLATITVDQQGRITAASSGSGTDASGSRVATASGALTVETADHEVTKGVTLTTDQASAVFTLANDIAAGKIFKFNPLHDAATIVVEGGAGSIDGASGGTGRLINSGVAFAEIISNAGTAPVVVTYGDVIHAPTQVNSTKTYDVNDSNQEFVLVSGAGTQTLPATASIPAGWEVAIYNESGGNITVDGADADITLADNDFVLIKKPHTSLLGFGSYSGGKTVLDAA